jgi:antitoxin (DNA-binding transcriptional repressor) of toxin-antitoxin stability system
MTQVEVRDFREQVEEYLRRIAAGDTVLLVRDGVPVAELRGTAAPAEAPMPRPVGLARGMGTIPPSFFEPLPDDLVALFSGDVPRSRTP